jgi:phosphatidylglycerophosphatase A
VKAFFLIFSTGFGTGLSPIASGTAGSLAAIPLLLILKNFSSNFYFIFSILFFFFSVWITHNSMHYFAKKDAPQIVIDEIAGMLIAMIGIPITGYWLLLAWLLFRFFDITKLPPANIFDSKFKNAWGVVLDDIVAGIYANIILHWALKASLD